MTFEQEEHKEKLYAIMKQEGTYLTFLRWVKRGIKAKSQKIIEDIYDRHGQNLDGDLTKKFTTDEVKEGLNIQNGNS
jgi:hypothetical protein